MEDEEVMEEEQGTVVRCGKVHPLTLGTIGGGRGGGGEREGKEEGERGQ